MEKITIRQQIIKAVDYARNVLPTAASKFCWQQLANLDADTVDPEVVRSILMPDYDYMVPILKCSVCETEVDSILRFDFDVDTCQQIQVVHLCKKCVEEAFNIMD